MSPAAVVVTLAVVAWGGLATLLAIAIGRTIREADARELSSCCPHPESEVPETVRGEFRPAVVQ